MQDGRYRQGNENTSHNFQEKESSKDSAYGYSGGENSRLATREPTPDAWQIKQQEGTIQPLNERVPSKFQELLYSDCGGLGPGAYLPL